MDKWYTVQVVKKNYFGEFYIKDSFNLFQKSGTYFKNPKFLVAFKTLIPKAFEWSSKIEVNYDNSNNVSFIYDKNTVDENSVISFLCYDGDYFSDENINNLSINNNYTNWKTISKIQGVSVIKFNKSNNYTFDVKDLPNDWNKSNLILFPFITSFKFGRFFTGYSIDIKKEISSSIKYISKLKYNKCSAKTLPEEIYYRQVSANKITRYLNKNCYFYLIYGHCYINHNNSQITITENDKVIYHTVNNSDKTIGRQINLQRDVPYNSNTKLYFDFNYYGSGQNGLGLKIGIVQALYEEQEAEDYEITCLVINKDGV